MSPTFVARRAEQRVLCAESASRRYGRSETIASPLVSGCKVELCCCSQAHHVPWRCTGGGQIEENCRAKMSEIPPIRRSPTAQNNPQREKQRRRSRQPRGRPSSIGLDQWRTGFREFLKRDRSFGKVFTELLKLGAEELELLELLYEECSGVASERRAMVDELRTAFEKAERVSQEAERLARDIKYLNTFVLAGIDREKGILIVNGDEEDSPVAAADFAYLPKLLTHYARELKNVNSSRLDPNKIETNGPELAMLGIYIRELKHGAPYRALSD